MRVLLKNMVKVMCFSFFIAAQAHANPDGVVVRRGDLRIQEAGSGVVFPDGSIQYKAEIQGPQGPQGPPGPQGPSGTTNGITKAVHGTFNETGEVIMGSGYSVGHPASGIYTITFATPFSAAPTCVVTPVGHFNDSDGYNDCQLSEPTSSTTAYISCRQYTSVIRNGDTAIAFICMQ